VHRPDGGEHGDLGRTPGTHGGDLPGAVGAHLGHEDLVPSASCSFTERARPAMLLYDLGVATTAFVPATR